MVQSFQQRLQKTDLGYPWTFSCVCNIILYDAARFCKVTCLKAWTLWQCLWLAEWSMDSTKLDSPLVPSSNCVKCGKMLQHVTSCSCHVVSEKLLSASKWLSASKCHRKFAKRGNVVSRSWSPWHFHSFLSWPSSTLRRRPRSWTRFSEPKDTEGHGFRILKDAISDVIWCDI